MPDQLTLNLYPVDPATEMLAPEPASVSSGSAVSIPFSVQTAAEGHVGQNLDLGERLIVDMAISRVSDGAVTSVATLGDATGVNVAIEATLGHETSDFPSLNAVEPATLSPGAPGDVMLDGAELAQVSLQRRADGLFRLHVVPMALWDQILDQAFPLNLRVDNQSGDELRVVFTVAVADGNTVEDDVRPILEQPWLHVTPGELVDEAILNGQSGDFDSLTVVNYGPGGADSSSTITYDESSTVMGDQWFEVAAPASFEPLQTSSVTVTYPAPVVGAGGALATLRFTGDPNAVAGGFGHNHEATLQATYNGLDIMLVLDASGSMARAPDGSLPAPAGGSRYELLRDAVSALGSILDNFPVGGGTAGPALRAGAVLFQGNGPAIHATHVRGLTEEARQAVLTGLLEGQNATGNTPMRPGIERGLELLGTGPRSRAMIVMSDGQFNRPPGQGGDPKDPAVLGRFAEDQDNVKAFTLQYGPETAVDALTLQAITGANPGVKLLVEADAEESGIIKALVEALRQILGLAASADPLVTVTSQQPTAVREFKIDPLDETAIVTVTWNTADARRLDVELRSPSCQAIRRGSQIDGVRVSTDRRFQHFFLSQPFLERTNGFGTWSLRVALRSDLGVAGERVEETFDYAVYATSALKVDVDLSTSPRTGDGATVRARLRARGEPITGAGAVLRATLPTSAEATFVATAPVTQAQLDRAREQLSQTGDEHFWVIKRQALANAGLSPSIGSVEQRVAMVETAPGVYSADLDVRFPGEHALVVSVRGELPGPIAFEREERRFLTPQLQLDPAATEVGFQLGKDPGQIVAVIAPKDANGTPLLFDPRTESRFDLSVEGGQLEGELTVRQDATYHQLIVLAEGVTRPLLEITPEGGDPFEVALPAVQKLIFADKVVSAAVVGKNNEHADPRAALGSPDNRFLALGSHGKVEVAATRNAHVPREVTVIVPLGAEPRAYRVEACVAPEGKVPHDAAACRWALLGESRGTTSTFSLERIEDATPVVRITDRSGQGRDANGNPLASPGALVDAVGFSAKVEKPVIPDVSVRELALCATNSLVLGRRAQVKAAAGAFGAVSNSGLAELRIGHDSQVGNVWAEGNVRALDRARINGDVRCEGRLLLTHFPGHPARATVSGAVEERTPVNLPGLEEFQVPFPTQPANHVTVLRRDLELYPGVYGDVRVHPERTLVLAERGRYFFRSLICELRSRLSVARVDAIAEVYVQGPVAFRGQVVTRPNLANLLLVSFADIRVEQPIRGTVVAPNGHLALSPFDGPGHVGSFCARDLELGAGGVVTHLPVNSRPIWGSFGGDLDVKAIQGVGEPVASTLRAAGIATVNDLAARDSWQPARGLHDYQYRELVRKARIVRSVILPPRALVLAERSVLDVLRADPATLSRELRGAITLEEVVEIQDLLVALEMSLDQDVVNSVRVRDLLL